MPQYDFNKDELSTLTTTTTDVYPNGSSDVRQQVQQVIRKKKIGRMRGSVTPNYRRLSVAGLLPVHPYEYSNDVTEYPLINNVIQLNQGGGTYRFIRNNGNVTLNNPVVTQGLSSLYDGSRLITSALRESESRALADLKSQKINVAQFIAERKQTINLIASSAMKIAGFILALKKGDIISAGKALGSRPSRKIRKGFRELKTQSVRDATADAWLAMQYGWKPLLSDIYGAVEMLHEAESDFQRFMAKSKAHREETIDFIVYDEWGRWEINQKYRCVVKHTFMFDVVQSQISTMGRLGLTNPLQLQWELVPYSFVVDWFVPIGNYLASLDATMGLQFSQGSQVLWQEWDTTARWFPASSSWNQAISGSGYGGRKVKRLDRLKLSEFPKPTFPEFKNPFSVTHVLNALALLSGAVSRRSS